MQILQIFSFNFILFLHRKQEERIGMNSERVKQIEMENILAQGDMNLTIDANAKDIIDVKKTIEETNAEVCKFIN